jgi:hypothetical protein
MAKFLFLFSEKKAASCLKNQSKRYQVIEMTA